MNIPNPMTWITKWRDDRAVSKIRDQYKYSLRAYAKRHSPTAEKDDKFIFFGIGGYFIALLAGAYLQMPWISFMSFFLLFSALLFPMAMSYYEQWVLKSKLTLTLKVIPNDPEKTRPITVRLEGVEFGAPIETPQKLMEYVHAQKGHLTHAFTSQEDGEAKKIMDALDKNMRLYPMLTRNDPIPSFISFPEDPDAILRPREEKVRLGYGLGKLRHATMIALECNPIKTSIKAKDKIIDVELALFSPIITQKALDTFLSDSSWHIPTRIGEAVATYVKQEVDTTKNASYFTILEKQRDDAIRGREKLQLQNKTEQMNADLDGDMMSGYKKTPGLYTFNDIVLWLVAAFLAGGAIVYMFMSGGQ